MNVLIIDDSDYKTQSLIHFLNEIGLGEDVVVARSFQSGLLLLKKIRPELLLLDMSLPTSERGDGAPEGRIRVYGGREILSEMSFYKIESKVVIITQFDHFGDPPNTMTLANLLEQLKAKYGNIVLGGVYYSNVNFKWREQLRVLLDRNKI